MAPPNRIFKEAKQRGLRDRSRSPDGKGNERSERRPLHERRRAYARVIRGVSPPDHWRAHKDDIDSDELEDAADIKAEDRKRTRNLERKKTSSLRGQKRKREEDVEESESPTPDPMEAMRRPPSSRKVMKTITRSASSPSAAPSPSGPSGPNDNGTGLHVIITVWNGGLARGTGTALRLPRDIDFHLPRSTTCGDLVTMAEMKMIDGVDQPQGSVVLAAWMRRYMWDVRLATIDKDVEVEILEHGSVLGDFKDEEDEWPLRLEGKILGTVM